MLNKLKAAYQAVKSRASALMLAGGVAVTSSVAVPMPAFAQATPPAIDTTAVTDFISGDVVAGIVAIGGVMLLVAATFAGFRWVRGAAGGN